MPIRLCALPFIAKKSPDAIRSIKRPLNQSALLPLADGLAMEFECSGALMGSPNQMEAIGASFEKREPQFADPSAYAQASISLRSL